MSKTPETPDLQQVIDEAVNEFAKGNASAAKAIISRLDAESQEQAWLWIAGAFYFGKSLPKQPDAAFEIWNRLADSGSAWTQNLLGEFYLRGEYLQKSIPIGIALIEKAAAQNLPVALATLGEIYRLGLPPILPNFARSLSYMQRAADLGETETLVSLAGLYFNGTELEQSFDKAFELNQRAAKLGNPKAHYNLGVAYEFGRGVAIDDLQAFHHYKISAEAGLPLAQHNLGARFANARGVAQDFDSAVFWYSRAASQGSVLSLHCLGRLFLTAQGVERNLQAALGCFILASEQAHEESARLAKALSPLLTPTQITHARASACDFLNQPSVRISAP